MELHAYERIRGPLGPPRDDHYSDRQVMAAVAPYSEEGFDLALAWATNGDDEGG